MGGLPPHEAQRFIQAVYESDFDRPRQLRLQFALCSAALPTAAGATRTDLDYVVHTVCTPAFAMRMLEDLCVEGRLTRQEAVVIEEAMLRVTSKRGTWADISYMPT
jgi:hypothetical protein